VLKSNLALVGDVLDERGKAATDFARDNTRLVPVSLKYDPDDLQLVVDDLTIGTDSLDGFFVAHKNHSVLLESTTLGFVELFLCCRVLCRLGVERVTMLYVEPNQYRRPRRSQLLHKRQFELSSLQPGYRGIPGATFMLDDNRPQEVLFFLGYEDHRLDRAIQDFPITRWSVVFGVPAYQAGWEMDAFANNINVLRQQSNSPQVHFCGAENPLAAYDLLVETHRLCVNAQSGLFVAPIGTKPHGIAAALFVAEHEGVGLLYDHPRRTPQRTAGTFNWHLFEVGF
jgi:hypothetical protein